MKLDLSFQENTVLKTSLKKSKKKLKLVAELQQELDVLRERVIWMQKRWVQICEKVNIGVQ